MTYHIEIRDNKNEHIGELMNADVTKIIAYINKGFKVFDKLTNMELTSDALMNTMGVSDCVIPL